MTSSKLREVLVVVAVGDVDEVEDLEELSVVEEEVAVPSAGVVEVRGVPHIHEYAILCPQYLLGVSNFSITSNAICLLGQKESQGLHTYGHF